MSEADHSDLIADLQGTLDDEQRRRFEKHLEACAECRADRPLIAGLLQASRRHGERFFQQHPTAEDLVDAIDGRSDLQRTAAVYAHLEICPTCALEADLLRGADASGAGSRRARRRRRERWPVAVAASLLLASALGWWWQGSRGAPGSYLVRPTLVAPASRDVEVPTVRLDPARQGFQLILRVDLAPASLPWTLIAFDAAGRVVYRQADVDEVLAGGLLFPFFDHRDFPPGDYLLRVVPAGGLPGDGEEFRFHVAED